MQTERNIFLALHDTRAARRATERAERRRARAVAKFRAQASDAMREIAVFIAVLACGVPIAAILHAISTYYYG